MNSEIVVLIPAYNPEERIINYVKELKEKGYTVIIVNDGSDKKHHVLFESLVDDCKIINCPYSKGKGNAIKKGLSFIKVHNQDKKGVCILEEDYPIDKIEKLNGLYEQNIFFVHTKGKRFLSKIFSMIYHQEFKNVDSSLLGFSMKYIDQMLEVDENCYEVQALIDCVQREIEVKEIVVQQNNEYFHLKNKEGNILYVIFLHLFRFISSSIISSVIDVLLAWLLLDVLKIWMTSDFWRIAIASLVARIISTIENYVYNKKIVFKERTESKQTGRRFLVLTVVITVLSTLFVYGASSLNIMSEKLAKPVGDLLLFLLSYNVQMKWVFAGEKEEK